MSRQRSAHPHPGRAPATAVVRRDAANSIVIALPAAVEEVVYNSAGRPVGRLVRDADGRLWLEKRGLDPAVHLLRSPRGWATDTRHLDTLRRRGGVGVRLLDTLGRVWTAPLETFDRHGIPFDRGHGPQTVLPLQHWRCEAPGVRQLDFLGSLFGMAAAGVAGGAP